MVEIDVRRASDGRVGRASSVQHGKLSLGTRTCTVSVNLQLYPSVDWDDGRDDVGSLYVANCVQVRLRGGVTSGDQFINLESNGCEH